MDVLFVFAHQDDEVVALPWIDDEVAAGNRVGCVFLTDGGSRTSPATRDQESIRVLAGIGVSGDAIAFLGDTRGRIADGRLAEQAHRGACLLSQWIDVKMPALERMYTLAWEGGHHDHDAIHAVVLMEGARRGISGDCWQLHLYNANHCPAPFFRVLKPIVREGSLSRELRYKFSNAWRYATACWKYRSQRRTWLGLFPELFVRRMCKRCESASLMERRTAASRPHTGTLLYERMFGVSYSTVEQSLHEILRETP